MQSHMWTDHTPNFSFAFTQVFSLEPHSVRYANFVHIYGIKFNKSYIQLAQLICKYYYYDFDACEDVSVGVKWNWNTLLKFDSYVLINT